MKKLRQTFYFYLSGNLLTLIAGLIGIVLVSLDYKIILNLFLEGIPPTYLAYKDKHRRGRKSHATNPSEAGFFFGFLNLIFIINYFLGLNISLGGSLIAFIIILPTPFLYIIGAIIYKDVPIKKKEQKTELLQKRNDIFFHIMQINNNIAKMKEELVEIEEEISRGASSNQLIKKWHIKKKNHVLAIKKRSILKNGIKNT